MKTTRHSVFETNSSSTHSISIAEGKFVSDKIPMQENVCAIYPGEFGWGPDEFNDAATKASYCLTWIKATGNEQYEDMLISVIQKGTKAKDVQFLSSGDYYPWGYIDHQSLEEDNPGAELFESENPEETLEKFIFNPKSILTIDNDNH